MSDGMEVFISVVIAIVIFVVLGLLITLCEFWFMILSVIVCIAMLSILVYTLLFE